MFLLPRLTFLRSSITSINFVSPIFGLKEDDQKSLIPLKTHSIFQKNGKSMWKQKNNWESLCLLERMANFQKLVFGTEISIKVVKNNYIRGSLTINLKSRKEALDSFDNWPKMYNFQETPEMTLICNRHLWI